MADQDEPKEKIKKAQETIDTSIVALQKILKNLTETTTSFSVEQLDGKQAQALASVDKYTATLEVLKALMPSVRNKEPLTKYLKDVEEKKAYEIYTAISLKIQFLRQDAKPDKPQLDPTGILNQKLLELSLELEKLKDEKKTGGIALDPSFFKQKYDIKFPKFDKRFLDDAVGYDDWRESVNAYVKTYPNQSESLLVNQLKESVKDVPKLRQMTHNFRNQDDGSFKAILEEMDKCYRCNRLILMQTFESMIKLPKDLSAKKNLAERVGELIERISTNMRGAENHVKQELLNEGNAKPTDVDIEARLGRLWKSCLILRAVDTYVMERIGAHVDLDQDRMPAYGDLMDACRIVHNTLRSSGIKTVSTANSAVAESYWNEAYSPDDCPLCPGRQGETHQLNKCRKFAAKSVEDKWNFIKDNNICKFCLVNEFTACGCFKEKNEHPCTFCKKYHNKILCGKNPDNQTKSGENKGYQASSKNTNKPQGQNRSRGQNRSQGQNKNQGQNRPNQTETNNGASTSNVAVASAAWNADFQPILGTAQVRIKADSSHKWTNMRAFLDEGSQINAILRQDVQRLKIPTDFQPLNVNTFNSEEASPIEEICWLTLKPRKGIEASDPLPLKVKFFVVDHLPKRLPHEIIPCEQEVTTDIKKGDLADPTWYVPRPVNILLSVAECTKIKKGRTDKHKDLSLEHTALGVVIRGSIESQESQMVSMNAVIDSCCDRDVKNQPDDEEIMLNLGKFFDYGDVKSDPDELDKAETLFREKSRIRQDGTYEVPMLWIDDISLGKSRPMCVDRNRRAIERLPPPIKKEMYSVMRTYIQKNIWVKSDTNIKGHYNPLTIVQKADSLTTPVRICMDASAKSSNGKSLNDNMLAGTKLQPDIDIQLMKLRIHKYAMSADVRSMYLNAKMLPEDQIFQRTVVIWENGTEEDYDWTTIVFGTKAAPYLANRIFKDIAEKHQHSHPLGSEMLEDRTYIDDINSSYPSIELGKQAIKEVREITSKHGFPVVKWASNEPKLLEEIPQEDTLAGLECPQNEKDLIKVLGLKWDLKSDELMLKIKNQKDFEQITKRQAAGVIAAIYDPLGFWGPTILLAKSILQDMWRLQRNLTGAELIKAWDEPLPPELNAKFKKWMHNLSLLQQFKMPRHIGLSLNPLQKVQIITFVDASNVGYGAVSYIRSISTGEIVTRFALAKSRVTPVGKQMAPKKKPELSIPRLELLAAVVGAFLAERVRMGFLLPENTEKLFSSDSMVVLGQIYGAEGIRTGWVERRLKKIRSKSEPTQWYHIKGSDNICADVLSRGATPDEFMEISGVWAEGPVFIRKEIIELPPQNISSEIEIKTIPKKVVQMPIVSSIVKVEKNHTLYILSKAKTFTTAKRVLAHVLIACRKLYNRFYRPKADNKIQMISLPTAMRRAEIAYLKMVQKQCFGPVLKELEKNEVPRDCKDLRGKNPFIEKNTGLLRLGTRIQNCGDYDYANPIVIPPISKVEIEEMSQTGHYSITRQIIEEGHKVTVHGGPSEVHSFLNRRFWVRNMRSTVKLIIHRCIRCAKFKAKPSEQLMGNVPIDRLDQISPPFSNIILDYAGPIEVIGDRRQSQRKKNEDGHDKNSLKNKVFIMVVVCQSTNAVYLDLVENASTDAFLRTFTRFVNTRGVPKLVRSDNATAFVRAAKILRAENPKQAVALGVERVEGHCASMHIEWRFSPPRSPHHGGHAEIFVKLTKNKLKKATLMGKLPIMDLLTVLKTIEGALNSRPLVRSGSKFDGDHYLTPAHFIMQRPTVAMPELGPDKPTPTMTKRYKIQMAMIKEMWRIHKPYFQQLASRQKWQEKKENLKENDLVMVIEDGLPLQWKMGVVTKTFPGHDGQVRVALVRTATGELKRGIEKLSKLPVSLDCFSDKDSSNGAPNPEEPASQEAEKIRKSARLQNKKAGK